MHYKVSQSADDKGTSSLFSVEFFAVAYIQNYSLQGYTNLYICTWLQIHLGLLITLKLQVLLRMANAEEKQIDILKMCTGVIL